MRRIQAQFELGRRLVSILSRPYAHRVDWREVIETKDRRTSRQSALTTIASTFPPPFISTGTASRLLRQRVLELVLQCECNGHRNFCLSASVHKNDIAYNRLGLLVCSFMMSSNNCETSGTPSTEVLTGGG